MRKFFPSAIARLLFGTLALPKPGKFQIDFPRRKNPPSRYLAVVVIVKNEGRYIAEWLEFQRLMGVEHVYIYDQGSTDNTADVLGPYVTEGYVSVVPWSFPWHITASSQQLTAQILAYSHAIMNFGTEWRWMAFIDVDEFLFPVEGNSLTAALKQYDDLPALFACWSMFGPNGHATPPEGLVIENYTMRVPFPTAALPKSIVDPAAVLEIGNAHMFDTTVGKAAAYNERRERVTREELRQHKSTPISNVLRLNHYYTRSIAEFEAKLANWSASHDRTTKPHIEPSQCTVYDDAILRFVPPLKLKIDLHS